MPPGNNNNHVKVYTIGFTKKTAREFFTSLMRAQVRTLIDVRLNNVSQLAGFTKRDDLEYFLGEIASIRYAHKPDFSPTREILDAYKKKQISWSEYEQRFNKLLVERQIQNTVSKDELDSACFLCSEPKSDKCHRRLIVEYLKKYFIDLHIVHL